MMRQVSDIDLLLIGKTGNGKSALGNAILRRKKFVSKSSATSVTKEIDYEVSDFKGKIIKVVDGPGVGDTRLNNEGSVKLVVQTMEQAMAANTHGYHAFLLVARFDCCFTAEDQDTISFLKDMFGKDFVRRFCILVLTCGDNFEHDAKGSGKTFDQWCRKQEGVFQELLKECDYRVVLFDNITRDKDKQERQVEDLLRVVQSLQAHGHRYTDENFELAQAARDRAMVESKKPAIREEILQETSLILQKLDQIRENFQHKEQIPFLEQLSIRCDELIKGVRDQDEETGALHDLEESISSVRKSVEEVIRIQTIVAEERRRMEAREKEIKAKMNEKMQRQKQQFEEMMAQQKKSKMKQQAKARELRQKCRERMKAREAKEQELYDRQERAELLLLEKSQELERVYKEEREKSDSGWKGKVLEFLGDVTLCLLSKYLDRF